MEAVKERIIGAITLMSVDEATSLWEYIVSTHNHHISLNEVPEVEATPEEARIIADYENGAEEYQPYISHEELKQQLNL